MNSFGRTGAPPPNRTCVVTGEGQHGAAARTDPVATVATAMGTPVELSSTVNHC